jgi:hypothetical protein
LKQGIILASVHGFFLGFIYLEFLAGLKSQQDRNEHEPTCRPALCEQDKITAPSSSAKPSRKRNGFTLFLFGSMVGEERRKLYLFWITRLIKNLIK